ncbi:MAG: hypothetical protein AAFU85_15390 [Planctomycetota bacterium]
MSQENATNERDRPTRTSALRSLPFISNSIFGWILAATFLMPFAVGCDKKSVFSPMKLLRSRADEDGAFGVLCESFYQWPYFYGLILPLWLTAIAVARPRRLGNWLLPLPAAFLLPLTVGGVVAVAFFADSWDGILVLSLLFALPQLIVLVWSAFGLRKDRLLAATRGISGLGVIASVAIYLHAAAIFASRFLYGFYVAMAATIGLTFSAWFLYSRGDHTFSDASLRRRPVQFRLRAMLTWTTLIAVIAAIYQLLAEQE